MITIIFILFCTVRLIFDNSILYSGAYNGLMLWYQRILPLMLPFLLLSSLLTTKVITYVKTTCNKTHSSQISHSLSIISSIITGLLCGCPIGARVLTDYYNNRFINKREATLLLPLCNNISPVFITGYIYNYIIKKQLSINKLCLVIYLPYFIYAICTYWLVHFANIKASVNERKAKAFDNNRINVHKSGNTDIALSAILQIAYIGLYIILCSVIIEFLVHYKPFHQTLNILLCGATEITSGTNIIMQTTTWQSNTKTALILSFVSFGGICTLLQTRNVINGTRLSMLYYSIVKVVCAICTYHLTLLIL